MKIAKIILLFTVVLVLAAGCKNVSEEIVGTWTFQTFDDQPQGTMTWTYDADGTLIRLLSNDNGIQFDSCKYSIDKTMLKTRITITGSDPLTGYTDLNGTYRIDKMKGDILIMTRISTSDDETAGSYYRCEMIRRF